MRRLRRWLGLIGLGAAAGVCVWLPLGLLGVVPSVIDVYGIDGIRTPASVVVGGLLAGALGFYEL